MANDYVMVSSQLNVGIKHYFSSNCGIAATQNFHERVMARTFWDTIIWCKKWSLLNRVGCVDPWVHGLRGSGFCVECVGYVVKLFFTWLNIFTWVIIFTWVGWVKMFALYNYIYIPVKEFYVAVYFCNS